MLVRHATLPALLCLLAGLPASSQVKSKAEPAFKDDDHTELGQRFKKESHAPKHHTQHGAWVKKPPIKHVPIHHSYFRKLPTKDGKVALPNGQQIAPADFHAGVNHAERALNAIGHSLRHPGARVKVGHHEAGHAGLKAAPARIARLH